MLLVVIKLLEVLARALFTIGATYLLAVDQAGQFGLANTLIGLFAFAFGWERHIDIQRRIAGCDGAAFTGLVRALPRLWAVNYSVMGPLLVAAAVGLAQLDWMLAAMVAVIAICEHVSNTVYNLSVVEPSYRPIQAIATVKSLFLAAFIIGTFLFAPGFLRLSFFLGLWAVGGGLSVLAMTVAWLRLCKSMPDTGVTNRDGMRVIEQYRASFAHFLTGVLAVLVIQIDRLVVGLILPLSEVGIYFRHVVIVSFAYQFFNVASYNRRLGEIFRLARDHNGALARYIINREFLVVVAIGTIGFFSIISLDAVMGHKLARELHINFGLLAILLLGSLIRIYADFQSLILNAQFQEKKVLGNQLTSFLCGSAALLGLTPVFGLYGTAFGLVLGSAVYLLSNSVIAGKLRRNGVG